MNEWETNDEHRLFELLVGDWYGENPENNLNLLREDKAGRANYFCKELALKKVETVLEIGSGIGFTSKVIAQNVENLHCCDISDSFLEYARKECSEADNITFHKIPEPPVLPFPENYFHVIFSDAVFIHLNTYDIYAYFQEFSRVIKPNGIVWVNIMDDSSVDMKRIREMAQYYMGDKSCLKNLLTWNSVNVIEAIAKDLGFSIVSKQYQVTVNLKFRKNKD